MGTKGSATKTTKNRKEPQRNNPTQAASDGADEEPGLEMAAPMIDPATIAGPVTTERAGTGVMSSIFGRRFLDGVDDEDLERHAPRRQHEPGTAQRRGDRATGDIVGDLKRLWRDRYAH